MKLLTAMAIALTLLSAAQAEVIGIDVDYEIDGKNFKGYLAYDSALNTIRPGVLVFHEWWGLNDYVKGRANELAELGYIAFACDMYGAGIVTDSWDEAPKLAGPLDEDRELMRKRAAAGLWNLKNFSLCDKKRVLAIGYCFGGTCALELARSGADLKGVVTFHGDLGTPHPEDAKNIKGSILVCTGADDKFVPQTQVEAFMQEMRDGGVDYEVNEYGGAVHSFTNPASGDDPSKGVAYNEKADKRSWQAMKDFFNEMLSDKKE